MNEKYLFLFPADPLDENKVDFDFEVEYETAKKYFKVALLNIEKLKDSNEVSITGDMGPDLLVIYRGWILKPKEYQILEDSITEMDSFILVSHDDYEQSQLLPNWVQNIDNTAKTVFSEDLSDESLLDLLSNFNAAVTVKDFVKSRKNEWDDAFYIYDVKDSRDALRIIHNFIDRQGDDLEGGIVLREFREFKDNGEHPLSGQPIFEEWRRFYLLNQALVSTNYWGKQGDHELTLTEADKAFMDEQASKILSPFFTIDFARLENGELTVVEVGDGQVSGLQDYSEADFYEKISKILP